MSNICLDKRRGCKFFPRNVFFFCFIKTRAARLEASIGEKI